MSYSYIPVELRRQVYQRANNCCEYCLIAEKASLFGHQVDHIIAEKHGSDVLRKHLTLSSAPIISLTAIGRFTITLLQFNRFERLAERELLIKAGLL